ncbi:TRAP transporter small permease [Lacrimispora sp.]|uniref:TRAP transporter small permease n=1 Tax=Lacrimispora sp. TaxID=2719234 RepID=UPI0032E4622E
MKKFYDTVYWLFMSFCKIVFIASICITTFVVFCRYILHVTPRWGEQAILLCMVYMALISASLAVRTDTHIRVMLIDFILPKPVIGFLKAMSHVCIFAFSLFMIIYGLQFTKLMQSSIMSGLGCKQSVLYASVPIAGVCMLLMQSERFILYLSHMMGKTPSGYEITGGGSDGR